MTALHPSIANIPMPPRMRARPLTPKGFPELYFAARINGQVDLRVADAAKWVDCVKHQRCWLCGGRLGKFLSWPIGPMCAITRVSSEPPSHTDCAIYAMQACPFLTRPHMRRREAGMPEDLPEAPGVMLTHNPGAAALWTSTHYSVFEAGNGKLIALGEPESVNWWTEGRRATGREVREAIARGLPRLVEMARQEGPEAVTELGRQIARAAKWIPADETAPA